mmetsp:Transcript_497/g.1071  ORF Transcript_497/g.1071 Transcript_497/m.1071 type:complete len:530 (-) Transcript_497:11-1600(-)
MSSCLRPSNLPFGKLPPIPLSPLLNFIADELVYTSSHIPARSACSMFPSFCKIMFVGCCSRTCKILSICSWSDSDAPKPHGCSSSSTTISRKERKSSFTRVFTGGFCCCSCCLGGEDVTTVSSPSSSSSSSSKSPSISSYNCRKPSSVSFPSGAAYFSYISCNSDANSSPSSSKSLSSTHKLSSFVPTRYFVSASCEKRTPGGISPSTTNDLGPVVVTDNSSSSSSSSSSKTNRSSNPKLKFENPLASTESFSPSTEFFHNSSNSSSPRSPSSNRLSISSHCIILSFEINPLSSHSESYALDNSSSNPLSLASAAGVLSASETSPLISSSPSSSSSSSSNRSSTSRYICKNESTSTRDASFADFGAASQISFSSTGNRSSSANMSTMGGMDANVFLSIRKFSSQYLEKSSRTSSQSSVAVTGDVIDRTRDLLEVDRANISCRCEFSVTKGFFKELTPFRWLCFRLRVGGRAEKEETRTIIPPTRRNTAYRWRETIFANDRLILDGMEVVVTISLFFVFLFVLINLLDCE